MKMSMITSLPTKRTRVFQRYYSEKHLSEFYPQDGGESQLALKLGLRHCHHVLEWFNNTQSCMFTFLSPTFGTCCKYSSSSRVSWRFRSRTLGQPRVSPPLLSVSSCARCFHDGETKFADIFSDLNWIDSILLPHNTRHSHKQKQITMGKG